VASGGIRGIRRFADCDRNGQFWGRCGRSKGRPLHLTQEPLLADSEWGGQEKSRSLAALGMTVFLFGGSRKETQDAGLKARRYNG
jgi:hypothetical protein